jgi:photosystem II stability/assembly factor-like uncharacterized protein
MTFYRNNRHFRGLLIFCFILITTLIFSPLEAKKARAPQKIHSTDPSLRIKGYEEHLKMEKESTFAKLKWRHLGPTNVSGRCTDIAVLTPKGKNYTIYVGSASGGLWKTENEGTTWKPIFDKAPSTSIGDIAVAPSNPEIIWVGTGEANIFRSSQAGIGVYRSIDGGKTWEFKGLADTYTISRIVIHPEDPDTVYVAASGHEWTDNEERGVYKTTDGGSSWTKILYKNEKTGAIDLVMDPSEPDVLYAAMWQRIREKWNDPRNIDGYSGSGIYKSMDAGKTWKEINNGLPSFSQKQGKNRNRSLPIQTGDAIRFGG